MRIFAFFILALCCSTGAFAQSALLSTQVKAQRTYWTGFAATSYSTNMYKQNSRDNQSSESADVQLNYRAGGTNLIRGYVSGYQENTQGRETKMNDGFVSWVNNTFWRAGKVTSIGQQIRAVVPLSKESRVRDEKITGISVVPVFIFNLTPVGVTGVTLIYQPQVTKNFHTYQQNRADQNNVSYSVGNTLIASWSVTDRIYIQPSFNYGQGYTYGNVRRDPSFQFATDVGYSFDSGVILSVGITNAGPIRRFENGTDQSISIYNNKTASVYTGLVYVF